MSKIQYTTDATFEQDVFKSDIPVLLDFWAEWCGPCRMLGAVLDNVAKDPQFEGKVKIVKMNIDENSQTPAKFGVRNIPFMVVVKDGEVVAQQVGALPQNQLTEFLKTAINA